MNAVFTAREVFDRSVSRISEIKKDISDFEETAYQEHHYHDGDVIWSFWRFKKRYVGEESRVDFLIRFFRASWIPEVRVDLNGASRYRRAMRQCVSDCELIRDFAKSCMGDDRPSREVSSSQTQIQLLWP